MSEPPPEKEETQEPDGNTQPTEEQSKKNRIKILQERDIPFEEERPPNFSPHFAIKVQRIRKPSEKEEEE
ncbi:MAG: hypothetical protein ACFFCH_00070 [Promethearchaeota archaeon]